LANLTHFHWLIFTSANAVQAFHQRRQALSTLYPLPSTLCTSAIGPTTARALQQIGITPTLIPPTAIAESLAEALIPHARQPDGTPTRFLLIRAETARDHLPDTLRAACAKVTIAPAYRTITPPDSLAKLQALFSDSANYPDAITFTSSSTAQNLLNLLSEANLTLPPEILRASIGPITSQTLRDLGHPPHLEAAEPTIPALVQILVKPLGLRQTT